MSQHLINLTESKLAILKAEAEAMRALEYSCVPGSTKEETAQDAVEAEVLQGLRKAWQVLSGFTMMVEAIEMQREGKR